MLTALLPMVGLCAERPTMLPEYIIHSAVVTLRPPKCSNFFGLTLRQAQGALRFAQGALRLPQDALRLPQDDRPL